eukprot:scpid21268/ scgid14009/ 
METARSGVLIGTMQARWIIQVSVALTLATSVLVYIIACSLKHVSLWLPSISDCATKAPEMYVFRFGMMVAAFLQATNVLINYNATRGSYAFPKLTALAGALGSFALGMLTVVSEDDDKRLHIAFTISFFALYELYMISLSINGRHDQRLDATSFGIKWILAALVLVDMILFIVLSQHWSKYTTAVALTEWVGVLGIQVFNMTIACDLGTTRLEEVTGTLYVRRRWQKLEREDSELR